MLGPSGLSLRRNGWQVGKRLGQLDEAFLAFASRETHGVNVNGGVLSKELTTWLAHLILDALLHYLFHEFLRLHLVNLDNLRIEIRNEIEQPVIIFGAGFLSPVCSKLVNKVGDDLFQDGLEVQVLELLYVIDLLLKLNDLSNIDWLWKGLSGLTVQIFPGPDVGGVVELNEARFVLEELDLHPYDLHFVH